MASRGCKFVEMRDTSIVRYSSCFLKFNSALRASRPISIRRGWFVNRFVSYGIQGFVLSVRNGVDPVEVVVARKQVELLCTGPPRVTARRRARRQPKMLQNLPGDSFLADRGDDPRRAATPSTRENVDRECSTQKFRPGQAPVTGRCVWADQIVIMRIESLPLI